MTHISPFWRLIESNDADTGEWHPAIWFFSKEHREMVKSERERIKTTKSNYITEGGGVRRDQAKRFSGRAWRGTTFHRS